MTQTPDEQSRWRCTGCGNLTRFDVRRAVRSREFWHFDLAGDHRVEELAVEDEVLLGVQCRWCGRDDAVELVPRNDVAPEASA